MRFCFVPTILSTTITIAIPCAVCPVVYRYHYVKKCYTIGKKHRSEDLIKTEKNGESKKHLKMSHKWYFMLQMTVFRKNTRARTENIFWFFAYYLRFENGKRYSVDTDIIVCTMATPISLSRLKIFRNYILFFNPFRT